MNLKIDRGVLGDLLLIFIALLIGGVIIGQSMILKELQFANAQPLMSPVATLAPIVEPVASPSATPKAVKTVKPTPTEEPVTEGSVVGQ